MTVSENPDSLVSARPARSIWLDAEYIAARSIDEVRLQMCVELHRAMYGDVWVRPEASEAVWRDMLDRIERAARAFRR